MKAVHKISLYNGRDAISVILDRYRKAGKGRKTKRGRTNRSPRKQEGHIHGVCEEDDECYDKEETGEAE